MSAPNEDLDPLAPMSRKAVSFKDAPKGYTVAGRVTEPAKVAQGRDFEDTNKMATWPNGDPKMSVVVPIVRDDNGDEEAFWATRPSNLLQALIDAQTKADSGRMAVGGHLTVTLTGETPNLKNPKLNAVKQYAAVYVPPAASDPLNGGAEKAVEAPAKTVKATTPPPAPSVPQGIVDNVNTLISVGMTDKQIADTPAIAAAGVSEAAVAAIRSGNAPF